MLAPPENANGTCQGAAAEKSKEVGHPSNNPTRHGPQLRCEACSKPFDKRAGRRRRFCSDACRKAAQRVKEAACCFHTECSTASVNDSESVTTSRAKTDFWPDPHPSCLSAPIDILGRGHRWPGARKIDRKTWANIIHREIGGEA
jgi:hypothetical protein